MSLFALGGFVDSMSTEPSGVTLKRPNADSYDLHGRAVARTFTTTSIVASVQAPTGAELKRMPEGFNASDLRVVYSSAPLLTSDQLTIQGADYQIETLGDWNSSGGFVRAVVRKFQAGEPRA